MTGIGTAGGGDELARRLIDVVGEAHVLTDPARTRSYETDWTGRWSGRARLVVRPRDTAQVAAVLRACGAAGVGVVPQGGNTGLVGGGVPRGGEVVLSLARLTALGAVDAAAGQVTAGAGVTLRVLAEHAAGAGLTYGVDFASRDSATVGGTVATNAGGIHVVRHGATRAQVLGLEAVLADGRVLRRMGGLPKDATGYDLPGLLTGSEGTLAVITAARLRLVTVPAHRVVALLGVVSTGAALGLLARLRPRLPGLTAAEWFTADGLALVAATTGLPAPLRAEHPVYLLVEVAGSTDPTDDLADALDDAEEVADAAVTTDRPGRAALWAYRERHSEALAAAGPVRKLDVAVPLGRLPELVDRAGAACAAAGGRLIAFGHLAEGNVHLNVLGVPGVAADRLDDELLRLVAALGGSISAEHGVGTAKTRWLALTRDDADRAAMAAIKRALDPGGLLNPGVLFG